MNKKRNLLALMLSLVLVLCGAVVLSACGSTPNGNGQGGEGGGQEQIVMTQSYASARQSFEEFSGYLLPELAEVTAYYESTETMAMVDISNSTAATLQAVKLALQQQKGREPILGQNNQYIWTYTIEEQGVMYDCELKCFFDEMVVVMFTIEEQEEDVQMTTSYKMMRTMYASATGVTLPAIDDIDSTCYFSGTTFMLDIVGGGNCTNETYNRFVTYFEGLSGWTGEDTTQVLEYPTYTFTNTATNARVSITWNGESEEGGIYLNAFFDDCDVYEIAKTYFSQTFDMEFPVVSGITAEFSCNENATEITFDMTKNVNFTEVEYDSYVSIIQSKIGAGTDQSENEFNKKRVWNLFGLNISIEWDLTTGISLNVSN